MAWSRRQSRRNHECPHRFRFGVRDAEVRKARLVEAKAAFGELAKGQMSSAERTMRRPRVKSVNNFMVAGSNRPPASNAARRRGQPTPPLGPPLAQPECGKPIPRAGGTLRHEGLSSAAALPERW